MSTNDDTQAEVALAELMAEHGFTSETRLYRHTLPQFLDEAASDGTCRVSANEDPSEAVDDVYGGGHVALAAQIGPGLAWAESAANEWSEDGRVAIELKLADALEQGGRIYPVESIVTDRAWYITLPFGSAAVRRLS
jgi:hypothetical protein